VHAIFATGAQLVADDDVTINGLRVGKVESIVPQGSGTDATLLLHGEYAPLFNDARATIKSKNLLGERYVEIYKGQSTPTIPNGGRISLDHTLTPVEVDQVLNALDPTVRDRLAITINSLGEAVAGQGPDLNQQAGDLHVMAASLRTLASTLAQNANHLDSLIVELDKVMQTLAAYHAQFRQMITDWDRLMALLASREQALQGTINGQDQVMSIFDQAFSGSSAQSLHNALAEAPATIDSADHYLDNGNTLFSQLDKHDTAIGDLFFELASVMSGQDNPQHGNRNMWRVYCVAGCIQPATSGGNPKPH
jgi:virulence factor Mce-like protein